MHSNSPSINVPIGSSAKSCRTESTRTPAFLSLVFTTRAWVASRVKRDVWWTTMVPMVLVGLSASPSSRLNTGRFASVPDAPASTYSCAIDAPCRAANSAIALHCAGSERSFSACSAVLTRA